MSKQSKDKRNAIIIRPETHDRLIKFGKYGDTMDDIVSRVIDLAEKK